MLQHNSDFLLLLCSEWLLYCNATLSWNSEIFVWKNKIEKAWERISKIVYYMFTRESGYSWMQAIKGSSGLTGRRLWVVHSRLFELEQLPPRTSKFKLYWPKKIPMRSGQLSFMLFPYYALPHLIGLQYIYHAALHHTQIVKKTPHQLLQFLRLKTYIHYVLQSDLPNPTWHLAAKLAKISHLVYESTGFINYSNDKLTEMLRYHLSKEH